MKEIGGAKWMRRSVVRPARHSIPSMQNQCLCDSSALESISGALTFGDHQLDDCVGLHLRDIERSVARVPQQAHWALQDIQRRYLAEVRVATESGPTSDEGDRGNARFLIRLCQDIQGFRGRAARIGIEAVEAIRIPTTTELGGAIKLTYTFCAAPQSRHQLHWTTAGRDVNGSDPTVVVVGDVECTGRFIECQAVRGTQHVLEGCLLPTEPTDCHDHALDTWLRQVHAPHLVILGVRDV
mmetsp:Transcript_4774/g.14380  ORF Transcript_4774/g.14380 Transcript_4774/m.14380 type:complete len:240 (-) Transcript_4774:321-1040(-)